MEWLKESFSPVAGAAAALCGCGLAGLAFLATAPFAGRDTRDFFAEAFFAFGFFMCRHSILLRPGGASMVGSIAIVKQAVILCSCSKIMSPHNCNETLSPCKDGDHESERVPTGESDRECSGREAERTRSLPPAAIE